MIWASFGAKGPEHFAVIESTTISGGVMQQDNVITEWLKEKSRCRNDPNLNELNYRYKEDNFVQNSSTVI